MCGIFAYIGRTKIKSDILLNGLKSLEYRGYDSWGISIKQGTTILTQKKTGIIGSAEVNLPDSYIGIGHTRWATHGGITQKNAHPHVNVEKTLAVVHNGIIENHNKLKKWLHSKKHECVSETDSEVVVQMMDYALHRSNNFRAGLSEVCLTLTGSNAFIILSADHNKLGVYRNGSPLVIGITEGGFFIASDTTPLLPYTHKVIFLENGEAAIISEKDMDVFAVPTGKRVKVCPVTIDTEPEDAQKNGYPHYLIKEIYEQKKTIAKTSLLHHQEMKSIVRRIRKGHKIVISACGSAYYCALETQYYFAEAGVECRAFGAYEMLPFSEMIDDKTVFIAISQSGETADTLLAAQKAKERGAFLTSIVNSRHSSLERLSDITLPVACGPEIAVVSTKAFTAQCSTLYILSQVIAGKEENARKDVADFGEKLRVWLNSRLEKEIVHLAHYIKRSGSLFVIGKHENYPAALECALKIKEVSYIHTEGFASGELKHGVIALIEKGTPCIVLAPGNVDTGLHANKAYRCGTAVEVSSAAAEMKARGGYVIGIAPYKAPEYDIHIPTIDAGSLTPIANIIAGQLLGYYLALACRADPDKPRNLAKSVTVK